MATRKGAGMFVLVQELEILGSPGAALRFVRFAGKLYRRADWRQ
jgi:hypothetical protein